MKERFFKVVAGALNERGYSIASQFEETKTNAKRQPKILYTLGMLPGEVGMVKVFKTKGEEFFAHVIELEKQSESRVIPKDSESYLASSPFQILDFETEQEYKTKFLSDLFNIKTEVYTNNIEYSYRNKVEFGFYEDYVNYSLNLSFFRREGNGGKYILENGSSIADHRINYKGLEVVDILKRNKVIGKDLKTLLIRTSNRDVRANLYVTNQDFLTKYPKAIEELKSSNISVIYSNKNSPASNNNGYLVEDSQVLIQDIDQFQFEFAADGFFQVNVDVFKEVIADCEIYISKENIKGNLIDFYSGVGVIGLMLAKNFDNIKAVDSSLESEKYTLSNAKLNCTSNIDFTRSEAEKIVEVINADDLLFLDPPRVGCHQKVIDRINQVKPPYIMYLSCNPITQAVNYELLKDNYSLEFIRGYNFYPKTPHLESLIILKKIIY
jgi:23S rRNA (uracil1939-C5)-methyltransferase